MTKQTIVPANGVRLHVTQAGCPENPLVILLHGFPEDARAWENLQPALSAAGFWVWAPDQRGYFRSEKPLRINDYRFDELAADVAALVEAAGKKSVLLVGHDWGASVAWWVAIKYPKLVERLVVLCGSHVKAAYDFRRRSFSQLAKNWYAVLFLLPGLPNLLAKATHWNLPAWLLRSTSKPGVWTDRQLVAYKFAWSQPGAFRSMINWYRAFVLRPPVFPAQVRIGAPALLIWGGKDVFVDKKLAGLSLELCDRGKLVVIENGSHWLHHEEPEQVKLLVYQFLVSGDTQLAEGSEAWLGKTC